MRQEGASLVNQGHGGIAARTLTGVMRKEYETANETANETAYETANETAYETANETAKLTSSSVVTLMP
jgi:PDZ domain-containing secreted protein